MHMIALLGFFIYKKFGKYYPGGQESLLLSCFLQQFLVPRECLTHAENGSCLEKYVGS